MSEEQITNGTDPNSTNGTEPKVIYRRRGRQAKHPTPEADRAIRYWRGLVAKQHNFTIPSRYMAEWTEQATGLGFTVTEYLIQKMNDNLDVAIEEKRKKTGKGPEGLVLRKLRAASKIVEILSSLPEDDQKSILQLVTS